MFVSTVHVGYFTCSLISGFNNDAATLVLMIVRDTEALWRLHIHCIANGTYRVTKRTPSLRKFICNCLNIEQLQQLKHHTFISNKRSRIFNKILAFFNRDIHNAFYLFFQVVNLNSTKLHSKFLLQFTIITIIAIMDKLAHNAL